MISVRVLCAEHVDGVIQVVNPGELLQPRLNLTDEEVLQRSNAWNVAVKLKEQF
jgi:hypothetical protein